MRTGLPPVVPAPVRNVSDSMMNYPKITISGARFCLWFAPEDYAAIGRDLCYTIIITLYSMALGRRTQAQEKNIGYNRNTFVLFAVYGAHTMRRRTMRNGCPYSEQPSKSALTGCIFSDRSGHSRNGERVFFRFYPEDVRRRSLRAVSLMAQTYSTISGRSIKRIFPPDILAKFVVRTRSLVFLLNRKYALFTNGCTGPCATCPSWEISSPA